MTSRLQPLLQWRRSIGQEQRKDKFSVNFLNRKLHIVSYLVVYGCRVIAVPSNSSSHVNLITFLEQGICTRDWAYSSQQWLATSSYYIKTCLAKLLSSPFPFTWSRLVSTRGNLPWRNIWIWDTRGVGGTHQSLTLHNIFSWFYNSYSDYITNTKLYSLNWAS